MLSQDKHAPEKTGDEPVGLIRAILESVEHITEICDQTAQISCAHADRMFGPTPEAPTESVAERDASEAQIEEVMRALTSLRASALRAREEASRFRAL